MLFRSDHSWAASEWVIRLRRAALLYAIRGAQLASLYSETYQSMLAARREGHSELLIITGTIRATELPGIDAL